VNTAGRRLEVLEGVKIGATKVVQGHNLTVNNCISGKTAQGLSDVRLPLVEFLPVARIQNRFAAGFDSDGAVAIKFDFFCGVRRYVAPAC